jgi:uncharacterized protein (TIGR02147 family)
MASEHSIFDFDNYKLYLQSKLGAKSARRGLKSALANALACQPTYISQVMNNDAHFSAEQASDLNEFFGHSQDESHFFILLVQKERAGKRALKKYYQDQIQEMLDRRLNLTKRLGSKNQLSEEHKTTFYSSWHYLAIHLALSIPELRTKQALARHFHLPLKKVVTTLEFLMLAGLARQVGEHFEADSTLLRIGSDSPHIQRHHGNWRVQALEALDREELNDLHYSAVVSVSRSDIRALKSRMLDHIKEYVATIRESKEEEVCVLCLDFFNLNKAES